MARGIKSITVNELEGKVDKREVGYYETPRLVADYMTERLLKICTGKKVLDPCCGSEELIKRFLEKGFSVDGFDIIKYKKNYTCNFKQKDFIKYYCDKDSEEDYDIYIANPPYNCHEVDFIKQNKAKLLRDFCDVGVHNMYSMFISAIIDMAKNGAVIGIICCDSFLSSKHHRKLREKILKTCAIHEITLCSRELFLNQGADVKTSIMILQKGKQYQNKIVLNNRRYNVDEFKMLLDERPERVHNLEDIILSDKRDNLEFLIQCPSKIKNLFYGERVGEKFKCITGISTGDDKRYLSDIKTNEFSIPFYKNPGKDRFYTNKFVYLINNYLEISKENKKFNVRNKGLICKSGITCSSMGVEFTASKLPENSTFGVNPNIICKEEDSWWLMAYLNSTLVTYLVRGVLIRGNMITSGYVSRIPLLKFTENDKWNLQRCAKEAYQRRISNLNIDDLICEIDKIIYKNINLDKDEIKYLFEFRSNIVKNS